MKAWEKGFYVEHGDVSIGRVDFPSHHTYTHPDTHGSHRSTHVSYAPSPPSPNSFVGTFTFLQYQVLIFITMTLINARLQSAFGIIKERLNYIQDGFSIKCG